MRSLRLRLPEQIKRKFARACSQKIEELGENRATIDIETRDAGSVPANGKNLVATAGAIHDRMDGRPAEFGAHIAQSSVFVHEDKQQAIERISAAAICPKLHVDLSW